jgi:hypothetical protein
MNKEEMPILTSAAYAASAIDPMIGIGVASRALGLQRALETPHKNVASLLGMKQQQQSTSKEQPMANARIVKIFIADADENIPLEKRVLYSGGEKLTDLTDQELFFEVPIKELLDKHNDYRKTLTDKKKTDKDVQLEPIRIRDLKMVVTTVASF